MSGIEKRKNTRVDFHTRTTLHCGGKSFADLEIRDLSLKGVFLNAFSHCTPGQCCEMELELCGAGEEVKVAMQGRVVRVEGAGTAIHFDSLDVDSFFHLKKIVYFNALDPETVEEELDDVLPSEGFEAGDFEEEV